MDMLICRIKILSLLIVYNTVKAIYHEMFPLADKDVVIYNFSISLA